MDSRVPKLLFVTLAIFAAAYFYSVYGSLPEIVASHFDANGNPNGWASKQGFLVFFIVVSAVPAVLVFVVPAIFKALPVELINLPNKRYWLSPERSAATIDFLTSHFAWFGCAVYVLMLFVFDYAVRTNLHPEHRPDPNSMWTALIVFAGFAAVWSIVLAGRFFRTPDASAKL